MSQNLTPATEEDTASLPSSANVFPLCRFPVEVLRRIVSFLPANDVQTFRTVSSYTRNVVDGDALSTYWGVHAAPFFRHQFAALTGVNQFRRLKVHSAIARASNEPIAITLDKTTTAKVVSDFDQHFSEERVAYALEVHGDVVNKEQLKKILSRVPSLAGLIYRGNGATASPCRDVVLRLTFFVPLSNLKRLAIHDQTLEAVDTAQLPLSLEHLDLRDCGLRTLAGFGHRLINLQSLNLEFNPLPSVVGSDLPGQLRALFLGGDYYDGEPGGGVALRTVRLGMLTQLTTLSITDCSAVETVQFNSLPTSLRRLDVASCNVNPHGDVRRFAQLEEFSCAYTQFEVTRSFREMTALRRFLNRANASEWLQLRFLPSAVVELDMRHLHRDTPLDTWRRLPSNLATLLINCLPEQLPHRGGAITLPPSLKCLSYRGERRIPLEPIVFPPALIELTLWHQNVRDLTFPASLTRLDLSCDYPYGSSGRNRLTTLHGVQLPSGLESLNVSHNKIRSLNTATFPPRLRELYAANNVIKMMDCARLPSSLRVLDLSHNRIEITRRLSLLTELYTLNLRDNYIYLLGELPPHLVSLNVAGNVLFDLENLSIPTSLFSLTIDRDIFENADTSKWREHPEVIHLRASAKSGPFCVKMRRVDMAPLMVLNERRSTLPPHLFEFIEEDCEFLEDGSDSLEGDSDSLEGDSNSLGED